MFTRLAAKPRPIRCLILAAATIVLGLIWRMAPLGLPEFLLKYGGSALWAVMVYWILAAALSKQKILNVAIAACLLAVTVECFKLIHTPSLDHFRLTLAGKLLIGRVFSIQAIVAYWVAIAITAYVDTRVSRPLEKRPHHF